MSIVTWKCCDGSFCNEWLSCKPCRLLSSVQGFLREQIWTTLDWLTLFWIYNQIPARKALEYILMSFLRQSVLVWPQKATGSPCFPGVMWWSVRFSWEAFQIRCYHSSNFYCRQSWKHEEKKNKKQKKEDLIFSSFLSPKLNTFNCHLQMYIQVINTNRLRISVWLFSNICHRLAEITRD